MKKIVGSLALAALMFSGCVSELASVGSAMAGLGNTSTKTTTVTKTTTKEGNVTKTQINQLPKLNLAIYIDNPILNVETDLVLAEELASVLKFNNLLLDRMPVSTKDIWPELLIDYQKSHKNISKKLIEQYNNCLLHELTYDYSFYKYYNPIDLRKQITSLAGLALIAHPSAVKKIAMLKVIESYGKRIEHTKNVISYKPMQCNCNYFNPKFKKYFKPISKRVCRKIDMKLAKKCEFFSKPLEDVYYKYEDQFLNLKVGAKCFKAVEGKSYPSFRAAFYALLPDEYRDSLKELDNKFLKISEDIAKLESEIKILKKESKKMENKNKLAVLEKKLDKLKKEKENIEAQRDKNFDKAMKEIEVDKNKIALAKKLKDITDYIYNSLTSVGIGTTVLSLSTLMDVRELMSLGVNARSAVLMTAVIYMHDNKAKTTKEAIKMAEKRLKLLLKRSVDLPKNAITIVYGIMAQKSFLSNYSDYIKAYVKLGEKLKK